MKNRIFMVLAMFTAIIGPATALAQGQFASARASDGPVSQQSLTAPPAKAQLLPDAPESSKTPVDRKHVIDLNCLQQNEDDSNGEPAPKRRRIPLEASWDDGLHFGSEDDHFHVHIGGIAQIDTVWLIGPHSIFDSPGDGISGAGNAQATQLRRASSWQKAAFMTNSTS
jgi:hypothetical protein